MADDATRVHHGGSRGAEVRDDTGSDIRFEMGHHFSLDVSDKLRPPRSQVVALKCDPYLCGMKRPERLHEECHR